jgi:hypothetical protein
MLKNVGEKSKKRHPFSPILCNLIMGILARAIGQDKGIKDIQIEEKQTNFFIYR